MPYRLNLTATPSQSLNAFIENQAFIIKIRTTPHITIFDLTVNSRVVCQGIIIKAGQRMIPFEYLETGNFLLTTRFSDTINYEQFNITQFLYYLTETELANAQAKQTPINLLVPQ